MIKEFWQYITTQPTLPYVKEMGFLKESIAMRARAERCQASWGSHYQNCQKAIVRAASRAVKKRKVVIFGAGSLNDIPLGILSAQFEQVCLVDLAFLKPAVELAAQFDNVELIEHDVTESLKWIEQGQSFVQSPERWLNDDQVDLVVSLNLITQLPLIPVRWLIERFNLSEENADVVGKQLIFAHLNYLRQFHGEVCLIADRSGIDFDRDGNEMDRYDPWWDIEAPKADMTWEWELIPLGEVSRSSGQRNLVGVSTL